jgi:U3 small nucleolar RNA-associated protein 11
MKTQDAGYIAFRKSIDDNKIDKLKRSLHFIGESKPLNHTLFVDDEEKLKSFDAAEHFDTAPELVDRSHNRIKKGALAKMVESGNIPSQAVVKKQSQSYKELKLRGNRSEKLGNVLSKLHIQKAVMGKGSKRKIISRDEHGKEKATFKWKRQRSK